jgi:hypothetical protein
MVALNIVMPALVAGIHVFGSRTTRKTWMPGTRPGMTGGGSDAR